MDFDLSEDQRLLKDSVDRLILDQYQFEQRKKYRAEPAGYSPAMWHQITELGLLGLPFDETLGGFGGGAVETAIVMEALLRGIPVISSETRRINSSSVQTPDGAILSFFNLLSMSVSM